MRTLFFFVMLAGLLAPVPALACRCSMWNASRAYKPADAVVVATVLKVEPGTSAQQVRAALQLENAWKLDLPARLSVESTDLDCPQDFRPGVKYLLYLYRSGDRWTTRNCVGNKAFNDPALAAQPQFGRMAQQDVAWLGRKGRASKVLP